MGPALYWTLFLAPFVQEDAAVFAAAGAAAAEMSRPVTLFLVTLAGLIASDTWKYWAGRYARTHEKARAWVEKKHIGRVREGVLKRLGVTLFAVRFIPGTRIAAYVAAGWFGAPFLPFFIYVALSGALYLAIAFALVSAIGMAAGERATEVIAVAAVGFVLLMIAIGWWRSRKTLDAVDRPA